MEVPKIFTEKYDGYNHEKRMEMARQTIVHGSTYEALSNKFLNIEDILNYLLEKDIDHKTMIAYRAVCNSNIDQIVVGNPNPDYNGKPFILLTPHDGYVGIYAISSTTSENIPGRTDSEKIEIANRIQKIWPKLMFLNDNWMSVHVICDSVDYLTKRTKLTYKKTIVAARSQKHIKELSVELLAYPEILIESDYLDLISSLKYDIYELHLLARCDMLKKEAPLYWDGVARHLYTDLIKKNIDVNNPKMNRKSLKQYINIFPQLFNTNLMTMSNLIYNLRQLDRIVQAYVLGFPIHQYVPSSEVINMAIDKLDESGLDRYCDIIEEQNKKAFMSHPQIISLFQTKDIIIGNEEDAYMEKIYVYSPFDIVCEYIDTHVYFFTRPEFATLATKKKNIWTNNKLSISILSVINSRIETGSVCDLPPSAPLRTLMERLDKDILYSSFEEGDQGPEYNPFPVVAGQVNQDRFSFPDPSNLPPINYYPLDQIFRIPIANLPAVTDFQERYQNLNQGDINNFFEHMVQNMIPGENSGVYHNNDANNPNDNNLSQPNNWNFFLDMFMGNNDNTNAAPIYEFSIDFRDRADQVSPHPEGQTNNNADDDDDDDDDDSGNENTNDENENENEEENSDE